MARCTLQTRGGRIVKLIEPISALAVMEWLLAVESIWERAGQQSTFRRMTLKQLEAFYWAGACGSFSIAARRLNVSQSALSKRIAELESAVGVQLFDRDRRRAVLTPGGMALLPRVQFFLKHADELSISMSPNVALRGRCRFGVGEIAASSWLPRLVARVKEEFPDLHLEPYVELGHELESKLIGGELDFAMIANQSTHPLIDSVLIAAVEYVWVVAARLDLPLNLTEELLQHLPVITMPRSAGSSRIFDLWRQEAKCLTVETIQCNSMTAMAGLTSAGLGVGYFPRGWIQPLVRNGVLRIVPSDFELQKLEYRFHWRIDDGRQVIERMREIVLREADYEATLLTL